MLLAAVCGFGFSGYRDGTSVLFVQLVPVYFVVSPAAFEPLRYARKIGSGTVPGTPV